MSIMEITADRLSGGKLSRLVEQTHELQEVNRQQFNELALLQENLSRLEQVLYSADWRMLQFSAEYEFSRHGLQQITELARIMRLKNPIIKRGVEVQRLYVWAQGVNIQAKDEDVNQVIQAFLDDERNQAELTTHQARGEKEVDLQQDGNLFFRFFIDRLTGRVRVRTIDPQEIDDIVCNPEDKKEPWYYRRTYTRTNLDSTQTSLTEYYPDWRYHPRSKVDTLAASSMNGRIIWDTPVYHVRVNPMGRWGVPEFYSALDWALAYKSFLEQLATVWQALARWAFKLTVPGGKRGIAAAKTKLQTTVDGGNQETNPPPTTGSMWIQSGDTKMEPFRTSGATMSAEDGRRLLLMGIQVFGFPETFYGDVSVGTLATAKSLDRPTELKIQDRRQLWSDVHRNIFNFVLLWAVKAPRGPLARLGRVTREPDGDEWIERVEWNDGVDAAVSVDFPPIVEEDVKGKVEALVSGVTLNGQPPAGTIPLETAVEQLLSLLGFQDVDEIMAVWRERQEEQQAGLPNDATTKEAWQVMTDAARELEVALREARNGHN